MKPFTIILLAVLIFSCKKKEDDPELPAIEFKSMSASTVEEFNNSLVITISYEDFQGDLGETDPDTYSVRIKDSRLTDFDWFHVPPVTPDLQELHVKGTCTITLDPLFLLGSGSQEQTSFSVELKDRAGNWSDAVKTPNVLIVDSL